MPRQLPLFSIGRVDAHFEENVTANGYELLEVDIGDITFQAGQLEPVHRWYRLTPSFAPEVVRYFLEEFGVQTKSLVFDPFSGRGTTAIECQKHGVPCVAFEINPLLQRVGEYSLLWPRGPWPLLSDYASQLRDKVACAHGMDVSKLAEQLGVSIPNIHDVYRWWKSQVLRDLLIARELLYHDEYAPVRHLLWLCVNTAVLDCANIHRNHPTITFDDNHQRQIDVVATICNKIVDIEEDMRRLTPQQIRNSCVARVKLRNSCKPIELGIPATAITHVITSPPYPNRFSYIHQTRPQLHFMEIVQTRSAATEIDLETIGGTWGRATSILMNRDVYVPPNIAEVLDFRSELKKKSKLMANYATKYFVDLNSHIAELRKVVREGFRGAYVVGNSRLSDVEIYTERILARLFEIHGFSVERVVVFRKRGGRQRLYECAVCVRN